jgi:hypothetical protein
MSKIIASDAYKPGTTGHFDVNDGDPGRLIGRLNLGEPLRHNAM